MTRRALQLASVASMIDQFCIPNIKILQSLGYKVDVVADFTNPGTITKERAKDLKKRLNDMGVHVYNVAIPRTLNPVAILMAFRHIQRLLYRNNYKLLHCHSPIGGVIARAAAKGKREKGLKVIYTAHGFHFYDGAPFKNWLIFYPIEKWFSRYTDILITINKEDHRRAQKKFKANKIEYIPGVGVDAENFVVCNIDKAKKRVKLGVKESDFLILSVGDVNKYNNHRSIIDSLYALKKEENIENIVYLVVGKGDQEENLRKLIQEYDINNQVKFLGVRNDVDELCEIVDCYVQTSIDRMCDIPLMEAMAAGLPLISFENDEYIKDGISGCCADIKDEKTTVLALKKMYENRKFRSLCSTYNFKTAKNFELMNEEILKKINVGYSHLSSIFIRQKKRKELGINLSDYVVISVGELNENKNHQVIIKAIKNIPQVHYVIVGKGALKAYLEELAKGLLVEDRVHLLGYRTDIRDLLWASDCFAFPSLREGLGLAALEGMSAGLPVIGHDVGGIRDYVINGETGWLCKTDAEYVNALNSSINEMSFNMYKKCISKASMFSIEKTNHIMRSIYR